MWPQLLHRAHRLYASANLLNPMAFPSLKRIESEIVAIAGRLMHGKTSFVRHDGAGVLRGLEERPELALTHLQHRTGSFR